MLLIKHPYETHSKTKLMEVVMDDLEERHEILRNDVNQLKEQMSQILEMLQLMQDPNRNALEQPHVTPNHPLGFILNQPHNQTQYPLYGLPPSYTPHINNNIDPYTSTSNLQNQTHPQDPNYKTNNAQTFIPLPSHDALNHQFINPTPIVVLHPHQYKEPHSTKMLQLFEEGLKVIEGADYSDFNVANLCLFPNVVIPPKFKLPEFDKYRGTHVQRITLPCIVEGWPHMSMMTNY
ncbi:hypothetical protein CR513_07907, partial [Mucuna pruriens]